MPDNNKQNDQKRDSQGQFTDKSSSSSPGHSSESGQDKSTQGGSSKEKDSGDMGHKSGQNY